MTNITPSQIKCIQAMISKLHLRGSKEDLIAGASQQRTTSVVELTSEEAKSLIQYLKSQDPEEVKAEVMRKKIISMAHEMGWHLPNSKSQNSNSKPKVDMARLDAWMVKSSILHKKLNQYQYKELPALITQFERVYQSFLKGI